MSQIEDEVALRFYAELESRSPLVDVNWWRQVLARVGRSSARRAGVLVTAEESGIDLAELLEPGESE